MQNKTVTIGNNFILEYMPFAPEGYVKVYLMCLYMAGQEDADFDSAALALNIDKKSLIEALEYWKAQGVINLCIEPPMVEFLPIVPYYKKIKLYSPEKYKAFNDQLHAIIKDRTIKPIEYENYYNLMESYNIEDNALLTIIGYCIRLQGASVRYQYIITVAKNLAEQGLISYDKVSEKLSEMDLQDADLRAVLKSLSLKRSADHYDRSLLLKWKNEYGFSLDVIIKVAKKVKRGGIQTLDMLMSRYYEHHIFDIKAIEHYEAERTHLFDVAKSVLSILGLKYEKLDYIIDTYISGWIAMGYSHETLNEIAKLCQKMSPRTLERMNATVADFYKKGIISPESFNRFFISMNKSEAQIKRLLAIMGVAEWVDERERNFYRTWTKDWKMPQDLLDYGAEISKGKANPIGYMNAVLSSWHSKDIKTVEEAKKQKASTLSETAATVSPFVNPDNFVRREFSAQELEEMLNKYDEEL